MKIAMTGNPEYGLAKSYQQLEPDTTFFSRDNEWDLSILHKREELAQLVEGRNFDVFINSSALHNFNQCLMLGAMWDRWKLKAKPTHIICIGSTIDRTIKGSDWIYGTEKHALKHMCNGLSLLGVWSEIQCKVTYISFGSLNTPKVTKKHPQRRLLDVDKAAAYIKWVLEQPADISLNELNIDPKQILADE
jgi:hypothetical protein